MMDTTTEKSCISKPLLNEYFSRKLPDGKVLVTTRHGSWSILSKEEYAAMAGGEIADDKKLCRKLAEKGIILNEASVRNIISAFQQNYYSLAEPRPLCIVYLTNRCNLSCMYCHSDSRADSCDLPDTIMENILDFMSKMPHKHIFLEFQGGETLLRFDALKNFLRLAEEKMKAAGKTIDSKIIVSNLTLMNEDIAEFILEKDIGLCTSFDGPKELHDKQRPFADGRSSYELVTKWADYFSKRGKTLSFMPTITAHTIKYDPKSIVDEYIKVGARRISFRSVYQIGRADSSILLPSAEEYFIFWKKAVDYMVDLSMNGHVFYDATIQNMLINIFTSVRSEMCARRPCGAGINHLSFYLDGSIYACDLGKNNDVFKLGDVRESTYEDVFLNTIQLRTNTSDFQPLCDTCVYGAFCGSCICKSYAQFGKIVPVTPADFDCKVNRMMFDYIFEKMSDPVYRSVFEMWVRMKI